MRGYNGIYFDNAATSYPKGRAVKKAFLRAVREEGGNPGRSAHAPAIAAASRVMTARETIATFFGMRDSRGVVFTKNATEALNLAIFTLTAGGGHVLYSDMEHNAVVRPIRFLESLGKIKAECFCSVRAAEEVAGKIQRDTVLVVCTHASNICGRVLPVKELGAVCRAAGVRFVVDASQTAGHLPLSVEDIGADIVCVPAHKGLGGVLGAGAALFRDAEQLYPPFLLGGSGSASRLSEMPQELPEHFEAGSLSVPAIAAMEAGVKEIAQAGVEAIHASIARMEIRLADGLSSIPSLSVYAPKEHGSGILSFSHTRLSSEALATRLDGCGVAVRAGLHCAPTAHDALGTPPDGTVRIGLGRRNTLSECDRFLSLLSRVAREAT